MDKKKSPSVRTMVLITTEKSAVKAAEMFKEGGLPIQYSMMAQGTASSEILDMLGLGSTEKRMLVTMLSKKEADGMLLKLHDELSLSKANGGIGFTLPISGANNLLIKMLIDRDGFEEERKEEEKNMNDNSHTLIAAVLNRGFSAEVMTVAREAGARGGTIVHTRQLVDEDTSGFWGVSMQEEKEMLLIITEVEKKLGIMKAISEKFGLHSEAKGVIVSMPIDSVMGF